MKERLTDGIIQLVSMAHFASNKDLRELIKESETKVKKRFKIKLIGFNG